MKVTASLLLATLIAAVCAHASPAEPAGTAEFNAAVMRRTPAEVMYVLSIVRVRSLGLTWARRHSENLKRATLERGAVIGSFVEPSEEELKMFEEINGQVPVNW